MILQRCDIKTMWYLF